MPVGGLVGAVHSRLDQLSNSLDQIGFYFSEIFVVMDKTHCGIIQQRDTTQHTRARQSCSMRSPHIIEDICIFIPAQPATLRSNHWTLSYLNWNWFPFLQEFSLWTFSGGAVLMSEPSLIPRGKKISTRTGKIYYYQNTLSSTHWNI